MNDESTVTELLELERRRGRALVKRDRDELEAIFADELIHIHSTGNVMNKAQLMQYVMQVLQFLDVQRGDLAVKVYGYVGVMTGKMNTRMQLLGKSEPIDAEHWVTQVWVKRGSTWTQTNFHSVRAAAG